MLFEEALITPLQIFYEIRFAFKEYRKEIKVKFPREIRHLQIDMSKTWGFFNCASERNPGKCGVGGIMFLSRHHSFSFSCGLGFGSNNMAEVKAVLLLVEIALEKASVLCIS
jgi:hypothetical protein